MTIILRYYASLSNSDCKDLLSDDAQQLQKDQDLADKDGVIKGLRKGSQALNTKLVHPLDKNTRLQQICSANKSTIAQYNKRIHALVGNKQVLGKEKREVGVQCATFKSQLELSNSKIRELEGKVASSEQRSAQLEVDKDTYQTELLEVRTKFQSLETDYDTMSS